MPTEETTSILYRWTVADAVENCGLNYYNYLYDGYDCTPIVEATQDGYRALKFTAVYEGETDTTINHIVTICMCLADGEAVPARYLLATPSLSKTYTFVRYTDAAVPFSWEEMMAAWEQSFIQALYVALEEWSYCFVEPPIYHEIEAAGGLVNTACATLLITSDAMTFGLTTTFVAVEGTLYGEPFIGVGGAPGVDGRGEGVGPIYQARSAAALEALAMSRIEISANNGDSMFSVTGGSRAQQDPEFG